MAKISREPSRQYQRCLWMFNIIRTHGPISREAINERYRHDSEVNPYDDYEIPQRTFQKTIGAIQDFFKVNVHCNRHTNEYTIEGDEELGLSRTRQLTTIDLANIQTQRLHQKHIPVQVFRIDALPDTAERLREHPICREQQEVSSDENGVTIFEYIMSPTWEWYEAIRSLGAAVKVIYPYWLSELVREDAQGVADMYKEEKDRRLVSPGFINPYICRIVDTKKSSLYLSIPWEFYEVLKNEGLDEYNVAITPENAWHLVQMDPKSCTPILDEDENLVPIHYDTIHFKVNDDPDSSEAVVEVTKIESFELTDVREEDKTDEDPMEHLVTYTLGKVLQTWEKEQ